jgi:hypothetical protein
VALCFELPNLQRWETLAKEQTKSLPTRSDPGDRPQALAKLKTGTKKERDRYAGSRYTIRNAKYAIDGCNEPCWCDRSRSPA